MTFYAYRDIFQNRSFRLFWLGFTGSYLGDALTSVAFTWFVYELTRSATALGWLMLCYTGPIVVGGLLAGWLLDRFDRRRVMIVDNLVRGSAVALVPLLYWLDLLAVWHIRVYTDLFMAGIGQRIFRRKRIRSILLIRCPILGSDSIGILSIYAVAAVYGLLMRIMLAGGPTVIPMLVKSEQLATANALEMLSFNVGGVLGPVLAGVLIGWIGAPNVVLLDVISYFAFAVLLTQVHFVEPQHAATQADGRRSHLSHAIQLLLRQPVLLATTLMFLTFNIGGGLLSVWLPVLVDKTLHGGPQLYGTLLGLQALGEVISALPAGGLVLPLALGTRICAAQLLSGLALMILVVSQSVWGVVIGLILYGISSTPLTIWAQTLRMRIIPAELRGRTFALLRMLMQSGRPIGGALSGILLPLLGIPAIIGLSALLTGAPGIVGYNVKELREAGGAEKGRTATESLSYTLLWQDL